MLQRLLNRLPRIFNKSPRAVPAITITKTGGATVTIGGNQLTLGGITNIALNGTLQELATAINAVNGYTCTVTAGMGNMLSRGLIEGTQQTAIEPVFNYPTSLLWIEMQVAAWAIDYPAGRAQTAAAQMDMATADSNWLDIWCEQYFKTSRKNSESDEDYLARTTAEVLAPTQNNRAIENIVLASHGVEITLDNAVDHAGIFSGRETELAGRFYITFPNGLTQTQKDNIRSTIQQHKAAGTDFIYTPTRVAVTKSDSVTVSDSAYSIGRTGGYFETLPAGKIKIGAGWKIGTPGLKIGLNNGMKEQVFIKIKNLDNSINSIRLSGG